MIALVFTTFLHKGASVVSVSCFFSSASSSGLNFGASLSSSPQKHSSAFLQKPCSFLGSVMQKKEKQQKKVVYIWLKKASLLSTSRWLPFSFMLLSSLPTQSSFSRSTLSSVLFLRLQQSRCSWVNNTIIRTKGFVSGHWSLPQM